MKRNKKHISSICLAAALLSLSVPGTVRAEESAGWVSDEAGWRYIEADGTGAAPGWKLMDGCGRDGSFRAIPGITWTIPAPWRQDGGPSAEKATILQRAEP